MSFSVWAENRPEDNSLLVKKGQTLEQRMSKFADLDLGQSIDGVGPREDEDGKVQRLLGGGHFDDHGFLQTLDIAYNQHQSLRLRPDDIWLLITMGFSMHINQRPEEYRHLFVNFEGKKEIRILEDTLFPGGRNDWLNCGIFSKFSTQIKGFIGNRVHEMLVADFSTTSPLDHAVSEIVLMDITKAYFEYVVECRCGIPEITLEGSLEDWCSIRRRIEAFEEFGLHWWLEDLRYVLDEFVAAKGGQKVNVKFWQRIFRGEHQEGEYMQPDSIYVSGWVHVFFPYLSDNCRNTVQSESPAACRRRETGAYTVSGQSCVACGAHGLGADNDGAWTCQLCFRELDIKRFYNHRVDLADLPTGFRRVPFIWEFPMKMYDCDFIAGFAGCKATSATEVRPQLAYCVVNKGLVQANPAEMGKRTGKNRKAKGNATLPPYPVGWPDEEELYHEKGKGNGQDKGKGKGKGKYDGIYEEHYYEKGKGKYDSIYEALFYEKGKGKGHGTGKGKGKYEGIY